MTLLSIVNDAQDEVGVDRTATVAGNSDPLAQKFLRLINKVGTRLMKVAVWQDLRKEQTFTAIAGDVQTSILPSDFDRFVPETFWNRTDIELITGPISGTEWQSLKANSYAGTRKYILRGSSVYIIPSMDGGETLAFEYVSNQWCQTSGGSGQTYFQADTDTGVLDEELLTLALIYEYLDVEGQPTGKAAMNFENYSKMLLGNDQPRVPILAAADVFGGRHFTGDPGSGGAYNINTG